MQASPHDANIAVAGSKLGMNVSVELGAVLGTLLGTSLGTSVGPRVDDAFLAGSIAAALGCSVQIGTKYIYISVYINSHTYRQSRNKTRERKKMG